MLRNEFIITNNRYLSITFLPIFEVVTNFHLDPFSSISLFSIPRNKRFVYINSSNRIRPDPLSDSIALLLESIEKSSNKDREADDNLDAIRPFKVMWNLNFVTLRDISYLQGFAKPLQPFKDEITKKAERSITDLLSEHVDEAILNGFDDSVAKYKGKGHFVVIYLCF